MMISISENCFVKECFANQNYLSIQKHNIIIPVKYQERNKDLVNKDVEKPPLALRVVPLPEFTINNHASQQNKPGRAFFLWIEVISYLRLIPNIAIYIYYIIKPC
ncbi:unnamed protein product [Rhizophagus irregularis]|nr:unnamed protein product [Rhizophagus irregularis]